MTPEIELLVIQISAAMDAKLCQVQEYARTHTHDRSVYFDIYGNSPETVIAIVRYHSDDPYNRIFMGTVGVVRNLMETSATPNWPMVPEDRAAIETLVTRAREAPKPANERSPYLHIGTIMRIRTTVGGYPQ